MTGGRSGRGHIVIGISHCYTRQCSSKHKATAGLALTIQYYIHIEGLKEQYCKIIQVIMVTDLLFAKRITDRTVSTVSWLTMMAL